jgi:hypothetical protein
VRAGNETIAHIPSGENRKEYALLIAAAPDLLDAARSAVAWLVANLHGDTDVAEKLSKAILKATGGEL